MTQIFHRVKLHKRTKQNLFGEGNKFIIIADHNFKSICPLRLIKTFNDLGISYRRRDDTFFLDEEDVNLIRLTTKRFETIGTIIYFSDITILDIIELED